MAPLNHEELQELCAAHALGALDPPESMRLAAHLREGCDTCTTEIGSYRRAVGAMGTVLKETTPPARAEATLMERVSGAGELDLVLPIRPPGPPRAESVGGSWSHWLLPAAALAVAGFALWIAAQSRGDVARLVEVNSTLLDQNSVLAEQNLHLVQGNRMLFEKTQVLHETIQRALVTGVQAFELRAAQQTRTAHGWAFLDPGDQGSTEDDVCSVHVERMQPPPPGQTYQAWMVSAGDVHDLGTFEPDESGHGFTRRPIPAVASFDFVEVTVEPLGGVRSPSGQVILRYVP